MVWGRGPTLFSYMWIFSYPSTICWRDQSFPIEWSCHSCWKAVDHKCVCMCVCFSLNSIHGSICLSILIQHWFNYCNLRVSSKIGKCESFYLVLFQSCFGYLGPLAMWICIPCKSEDWLFHFCKRGCWNFDRGCVESVDHCSLWVVVSS